MEEHGWTKMALDCMPKVDSFFRESQRLNSIGTGAHLILISPGFYSQTYVSTVTLARIAIKDFKFSDGTVLPAGTFVAVPLYATHHDESVYRNPDDFDPDRFVTSNEHGNSSKIQMVTPTTEYIHWGLGKHAWYVRSLMCRIER